jgi:hypothetical protein
VKIEIVNDSQVRAKAGHTRVFIPLSVDVLNFYNDLGKWFLHFSEPESLSKAILPKRNRNLGTRRAAVIYRRGVRVREFESSETESLLDYNLDALTFDEARKASDWDVRHHCGRALAGADKATLTLLFEHLMTSDRPVWEFTFDTYALQPSYRTGELDAQRKNWQQAFEQVAGGEAVLTQKGTAEQLERKGYRPITAPEGLVNAASQYGLQTASTVLSMDELSGREIIDSTPDAQAAVDLAWEWVEEAGMTNGKTKPPVRCFTSLLDGGTMLNGYYRDGTVFINSDLAGKGFQIAGVDALSNRLLKVALEELSHFVTEAQDSSRDFQDFLLELAVRTARSKSEQRLSS